MKIYLFMDEHDEYFKNFSNGTDKILAEILSNEEH